MGSINHDEILRKYLKEFINNNYLSCYLHDLFKSIIVRGGQERRDCDITASISEQTSEFAKKTCVLETVLKNYPQ
ncbi:uncharacterised protein [Saccharolobus solfataricus]|uniref:Uncharacterized protein n=1 Tax=Saccharolobus solfataricus TaxID=2287 RepID=A0A157T1I8_SACSO|nr:uncharacterised protein [Saccharolobus solfataricus]